MLNEILRTVVCHKENMQYTDQAFSIVHFFLVILVGLFSPLDIALPHIEHSHKHHLKTDKPHMSISKVH